MQQQCEEHAAIVVAPRRAESLDQEVLETLLREGRRFALSTLGKRRPRTRCPVSAGDAFATQVCPRKALLRRCW
ncbi:hypothetical protein WK64_23260 [Burkholderia ubonensis]|nr:hypothetical protein WK08_01890 [Burkholderia ubonensis]KVU28354.1 hypothetical protein WK64_23260 [Burkholderia ubonensis]